MIDRTGSTGRQRPGGVVTPYQDLYIYYVDGRPRQDLTGLGGNFIGNWEEEGCSFLFFRKPASDVIDRLLAADSRLSLLDRFHMTYDEWQGGGFSTFRAGCLVIAPPWEEPQPTVEQNEVLVRLDPGVVFGTGTHATTRDCLEALQMACRECRCHTALDLGTGTGLLALAAASLGCGRVLAVDLNPLAVRTARDNVRLNHMQHCILAVQGDAEAFMGFPGDLVIANIHYEVMARLITSEGFLKKRCFILSGLLRSQAREVRNQLERMPTTLLEAWECDGIWTTFYGKIDSITGGSGRAG